MIDRFDADVRAWMDERGQPDRAVVSSLLAGVDQLPARPRRPSPWVLAATVLIVVSAALIVPRLSSLPVGVDRPTPPDPAAFADDPRLRQCFGDAGPVQFAFVMLRARDYQRHFPAMLRSPELDVDEAGFVVVFAAGAQPAIPRAGPPGSSPEERFVCVLVGDSPNLYSDVDITGMRVDLPVTAASAAPTASSTAVASPDNGMPDPGLLFDDPGFLACQDHEMAESAFRVTRAVDIRWYLPGFTGREPELTTGAPATVVVMAADYPVPPYPGPSGAEPLPTSGPIHRVICVAVSTTDPPTPGYFYAVPISGFDPDPAILRRAPDEQPWLDQDGVSSTTVTSFVGPERCGHETTVWLYVDDDLFFRDPLGLLRDIEEGTFETDVPLPADAIDTGLTSRGRHLFLSADGGAVFVQTPNGVERWPRSTDPTFGCA